MSRGHSAATHNRSVYADIQNCGICASAHQAALAAARNAEAGEQAELLAKAQAMGRERARQRRAAELKTGRLGRIRLHFWRFIAATIGVMLAGAILTYVSCWIIYGMGHPYQSFSGSTGWTICGIGAVLGLFCVPAATKSLIGDWRNGL